MVVRLAKPSRPRTKGGVANVRPCAGGWPTEWAVSLGYWQTQLCVGDGEELTPHVNSSIVTVSEEWLISPWQLRPNATRSIAQVRIGEY